MKNAKLLFIISLTMAPVMAGAATCSRANLTRCLDSACAINISSNPAARCQYCGTDTAGAAPADNGMRSVSVGQSAKYTFSAKELKSAPDDPGERYAWASKGCLKKLDGCTPDDIEDTYDTLIEQSCKAAGISAQMASLQAAARQAKNMSSCKTDIRACLIAEKRCHADYRACDDNAVFDRYFSECSIEATGCDAHISAIRTELVAARDTAVKNADSMLATLVASYQDGRAKRLAAARADCTDNAGREACIESVCERSMRNKCGVGYESERSMATQLCKFYDIACATLK